MEDLKHVFIKSELIDILENSLNKTLGEIDIKNDFARTISNPKITGIAGDVVEHSILGYESDQRQEPDIIVDGEKVEVKTTGIRINKKEKIYEAKEPMSVTAVSPDKIVHETFDDSNFWHKLKDMLLIYYHYDSYSTVKANQYANFYVRGYEFHKFSDEDKLRLMCDWEIVHDFIKELQANYDNPTLQYPRISHELRDKLVYIDTAPKWPNPPRFRLKRQFVTKIVRNYFGDKLEILPQRYSSYNDIDKKCHELTVENKGKNVLELLNKYNIEYKEKEAISKSICEQIIIKMFGGTASSLNKIEMFDDFNIIGKTITLNIDGLRTEDMKLSPINFEEWCDSSTSFEQSMIYDYFMNHQFLCIEFKEIKAKTTKVDFWSNEFSGFKRLSFDDEFINNEVKPIWEAIRTLVNNNELKETVCISKKNNQPIINKTGTIKTSINFPKSKNSLIFVRGTGIDSTKKTKIVNGIHMYQQYIWIKGKYIVDKISKMKDI